MEACRSNKFRDEEESKWKTPAWVGLTEVVEACLPATTRRVLACRSDVGKRGGGDKGRLAWRWQEAAGSGGSRPT